MSDSVWYRVFRQSSPVVRLSVLSTLVSPPINVEHQAGGEVGLKLFEEQSRTPNSDRRVDRNTTQVHEQPLGTIDITRCPATSERPEPTSGEETQPRSPPEWNHSNQKAHHNSVESYFYASYWALSEICTPIWTCGMCPYQPAPWVQ